MAEDPTEKLKRLVHPLGEGERFANGWVFGGAEAEGAVLKVTLEHEAYDPVRFEIRPPGGGPSFARTNHFEISYSGELSLKQQDALRAVTRAILSNGF